MNQSKISIGRWYLLLVCWEYFNFSASSPLRSLTKNWLISNLEWLAIYVFYYHKKKKFHCQIKTLTQSIHYLSLFSLKLGYVLTWKGVYSSLLNIAFKTNIQYCNYSFSYKMFVYKISLNNLVSLQVLYFVNGLIFFHSKCCIYISTQTYNYLYMHFIHVSPLIPWCNYCLIFFNKNKLSWN